MSEETKPQETVEELQVETPEASQAEASQAEAPQAEAPQAEAPQAEAPQAEAPQAEAPQAEASAEAEQQGTQELQRLLVEVRGQAEVHRDQLLRAQAELENTRRRAERDVENAHKYALERFAQDLLPVRDSLEMGLASATGEDEGVAKLREGTELTLKMLAGVMEKYGIEQVDPAVGEPFNPEVHQAMTMQPSQEHLANAVLMVMQKGYTLNGRLLRPAMVAVSKGPADS